MQAVGGREAAVYAGTGGNNAGQYRQSVIHRRSFSVDHSRAPVAQLDPLRRLAHSSRRALASGPMPNPPMTGAELEALLRTALPPLTLALRERFLKERRFDPVAAAVEDVATAERIQGGLAQLGWWS